MGDASGTVDFEEFLNEEAKNIISDRYTTEKTSLASKEVSCADAVAEGEESGPALLLSEEQVEHARMKFADWDKDGNGRLSLKELQGITKDLNLKTTAKKFRAGVKKLYQNWDSDGDGNLSFEEFLPIYNFLFVGEMDFASC